MDHDEAYYQLRITEERRAGMAAASEKVRNCHFELAAAYQLRLEKMKSKRRRTLRIVTPA